ncbi:TIGR03032 family protein [Allosphingosinicella sp.]|uniref:TIGR03032 family protein n=1 Tax=Allosphingosinicella sp. TaxID=2823234 RepID=UPI0037848BD6
MAKKKSAVETALDVAVEEAQAAPQPAQPAADQTQISVSRGFGNWLIRNNCSLAFSSYQTGQLFLVGMMGNGQVSFHQQNYVRAMGLHATPQRLYVGSLFQIWRLENVLAPHERANEHFDRLYVPRNAQTTGDIDVHELNVDKAGRVIFVNTKFSCLATMSVTHGFKPLWKPSFISRLAAEDRCHLNGLAMADGAPAYVTAVSRSDMINGWRDRRHEGGVLIDVRHDRVVTDQLSMPHSPRVTADGIYLLDSGRGQIARIDPETGAKTDIAFCPGFLRGLAIHNGHAIATVSLPRDGAFGGLALQDELKKRDGEPWCGVCIVDLRSGDLVEWIRLNGAIKELFDVAVIPDVRCPMALGVQSPDIQSLISFDPDFGPLVPPQG